MTPLTLRTVGIFWLCAWVIASGCDPASDSAQGDGGATDGSAEAGNDADSAAEEGDPDADAAAEDGGAGSGDAGSTSETDGAAADAGASGDAGAGDASTQMPVKPTVLVPVGLINHISIPEKIEVDDEYVYWTGSWVGADPPTPLPQPRGAYLLRVPKNGGDVEALYEAPKVLNPNFAMDATSLYVSQGVDNYSTVIIKVAKDGSGTEELATPPDLNTKASIAIDDQNLYFNGQLTGEIQAVPLEGGPIVTLVYPDGFTYYPFVFGLTTDGTNLYYCDDAGIFQVPVSGGTPLLLHTRNMDGARISHHQGYPALAGGRVYWNYYGYIYSVPVGGGTVTTLVEPTGLERGGSGPYTAIDGDYVYYLAGGSLHKAALDGSSRVTLLEDGGKYNLSGAIAFDETRAYMHAANGQSIIKIPK